MNDLHVELVDTCQGCDEACEYHIGSELSSDLNLVLPVGQVGHLKGVLRQYTVQYLAGDDFDPSSAPIGDFGCQTSYEVVTDTASFALYGKIIDRQHGFPVPTQQSNGSLCHLVNEVVHAVDRLLADNRIQSQKKKECN